MFNDLGRHTAGVQSQFPVNRLLPQGEMLSTPLPVTPPQPPLAPPLRSAFFQVVKTICRICRHPFLENVTTMD